MATDLARLDIAIRDALAMRAGYTQKGREHWCQCPNPGHSGDRPGSSFSYNADKMASSCFGCSFAGSAIETAELLGIDVAAFKNGHAQKATPRKLAVSEPYHNADGSLAYTAERWEWTDEKGKACKDFVLRAPDGAPSIKGIKRVLFRLPEVLAAIEAGKPVYLVEGEKCVRACEARGLVATTNCSGSNSWREEYAASLAGARVAVLRDNDKAGESWLAKVLKSILPVAKQVKAPELPGLGTGEDIFDWKGTTAELKALVKEAPEATLPDGEAETLEDESLHFTDLGNAKRFVKRFGEDLRYAPHLGKSSRWLKWDGARWASDVSGAAERLAKKTAVAIAHEGPAKSRKEFVKWSLASESRSRIENMLRLAQTEEGIPVQSEELDVDPYLLACPNGTVDLRTGELREASRADYITKCTGVAYDPAAKCERWEKFVLEVMGGDQEMAAFLKRAAGYSLTGVTIERCFFILHGLGSNGKSTFTEMLRNVLSDYAKVTKMDTFMAREAGSASNDVAALIGSRIVCASESDFGQRLSESLIKELTSGIGAVTARYLYSEHFTFEPQFKIWLSTNHKPNIRGVDFGIWDRIRLIPFECRFTIDKKLQSVLKSELPGILRWCIEGCLEWQSGGLREPSKIVAATADYRNDQDLLADWLFERTIAEPEAVTPHKLLYEDYLKFCEERADKHPFSPKQFSNMLSDRGFLNLKKMSGNARKHIRLRDPLFDVEPDATKNMEGMEDKAPLEILNAGGSVYEVSGKSGQSSIPSIVPEKPLSEDRW